MEAFFSPSEQKHSTYLLLLHTSSSSSPSPPGAEPRLAVTRVSRGVIAEQPALPERPSPACRGVEPAL